MVCWRNGDSWCNCIISTSVTTGTHGFRIEKAENPGVGGLRDRERERVRDEIETESERQREMERQEELLEQQNKLWVISNYR